MGKFKNSFEQFKKDPEKWRQNSWDNTSKTQVNLLNIISKLIYGFGTLLGFFLGFAVDKKYFFMGILFLIMFFVLSPKKFKDKYGSKNK
ncbi:Uncharacterised protein [[Clostridium] sordellii]|uniref:hypothetical protein n=1 Tax=Paraclostridium sordellii TaxID=1505 RepID=UPI0005DF46B7|nr:hypothetical protein [Paeniclostridium sordellii]CEP43031.1 Uncharacterised protein [[Clostridium] sordellii] [Paeniclostridium sordellii]